MQNKKIIRIVESFVVLPIITMSVPAGSIPNPVLNITQAPYSVFSEKQNIEAKDLFTSNSVEDPKAKMFEAQGQAIDAYYKKYNMPLIGTGKKMAEEAYKNSLDYRLLPAISVQESTGGKFACKTVKFNAFGWHSCRRGFESYDKAIEIISLNLGGGHEGTAKYYDNKTIIEILHAYNPPTIAPNYAKEVMRIMDNIGAPDLGYKTIPSELTSSYAPLVQIM